MAKLMRSEGSEAPIWKIFDHQPLPQYPLKNCPECNCTGSLVYIGFAPNYGETLQAKMYQCRECDTWLDAVSPRLEYRKKLHTPEFKAELTLEMPALKLDTAAV